MIKLVKVIEGGQGTEMEKTKPISRRTFLLWVRKWETQSTDQHYFARANAINQDWTEMKHPQGTGN